jgi:hypothetical protein
MLHYEILDTKRNELLQKITEVGAGFYLAGGTALALQIGHRDSIDFDFFIEGTIDTTLLWEKIQNVFTPFTCIKTQEEKDTLSCIITEEIRLSFFGYPYPLIAPALFDNNLKLASLRDIGAMKLSAITSRATLKDYIDIYFILKDIPLTQLLEDCTRKFPQLDQNLILKSLVYFDDITTEPIKFIQGYETTIEEIQTELTRCVQNYLAK